MSLGGNSIDANGDGEAGGILFTNFRTVSLSVIDGTSVFGFLFDSNRVSTDGTDIPIVGARINVDGMPNVFAVTDENGFFRLEDVPSSDFFVEIDGREAIAPDGFSYGSARELFESVPGEETQITNEGEVFDVYLPIIADADATQIVQGQATTATFGDSALDNLEELFPDIDRSVWERLQVNIPADSITFDDGTAAEQVTVVALDPDRLPAPLPDHFDPTVVFSVDAGGAENALGSSQLIYPNVNNLPPGATTSILAFDHEAGEWVSTGSATVSGDGLIIVSDEGAGVRTLGWRIVLSLIHI